MTGGGQPSIALVSHSKGGGGVDAEWGPLWSPWGVPHLSRPGTPQCCCPTRLDMLDPRFLSHPATARPMHIP